MDHSRLVGRGSAEGAGAGAMSTLGPPLAYTIRECADALRVSERTVRRAISSGRLNAVRITSRAVRVRAADLEEFVRRNAMQAREERNGG